MERICYVCGFQTENEENLKHCPDCGGLLQTYHSTLTCSDCKHFTGKNCVAHPIEPPALFMVTGPPQCTAFEEIKKDKDETVSLQDIKDIQNLDRYEEDPAFVINVPKANLIPYNLAAKDTKAKITVMRATIKGVPYTKHSIFAIFLIAGPSKEDYLRAVRKRIKEILWDPNNHTKTFDFAKMEKEMIEKHGIDPGDPYGKLNLKEQIEIEAEEALANYEDDGWGDYEDDGWGDYEDYDPFEAQYKYDQGFLQNIDKQEQVVYQQAANNLGIEIEFKEGATDIHGQPLSNLVEIYVPKEEERGKAKNLYDEVQKIHKQIAATKPSKPKEYTFPLAVHFDPNEVLETVKKSIDTPLYVFNCTPLSGGGYELRFVFRNELEKVEYNLLALIVMGQYKEGLKAVQPGEQNPEIASFSKSLKEGMKDPGPFVQAQETVWKKIKEQKEKFVELTPELKEDIKNMVTKKEVKKAQVNLEKLEKLTKETPFASKAKMLKKAINDKLLEANENNDIIDWTLLNKSLAEGLKVPKHLLEPTSNTQPEALKKLLTVSAEDAVLYQEAANQIEVIIVFKKAEGLMSNFNNLYDIFILKNYVHRATDLVKKVSSLKNESKLQQALQPPPPMVMGIDWHKGEKPKKKRKDCKPGQRKVKFKKDED